MLFRKFKCILIIHEILTLLKLLEKRNLLQINIDIAKNNCYYELYFLQVVNIEQIYK